MRFARCAKWPEGGEGSETAVLGGERPVLDGRGAAGVRLGVGGGGGVFDCLSLAVCRLLWGHRWMLGVWQV